MHYVKVGTSLCLAQLDLQEASTEACITSPGPAWVLARARANSLASWFETPQLQLLLMAGSHPAFLSNQGYNKVAHCQFSCLSWQPKL